MEELGPLDNYACWQRSKRYIIIADADTQSKYYNSCPSWHLDGLVLSSSQYGIYISYINNFQKWFLSERDCAVFPCLFFFLAGWIMMRWLDLNSHFRPWDRIPLWRMMKLQNKTSPSSIDHGQLRFTGDKNKLPTCVKHCLIFYPLKQNLILIEKDLHFAYKAWRLKE